MSRASASWDEGACAPAPQAKASAALAQAAVIHDEEFPPARVIAALPAHAKAVGARAAPDRPHRGERAGLGLAIAEDERVALEGDFAGGIDAAAAPLRVDHLGAPRGIAREHGVALEGGLRRAGTVHLDRAAQQVLVLREVALGVARGAVGVFALPATPGELGEPAEGGDERAGRGARRR